MIKREFVENNLVKVLNYLPWKIDKYYLYISKIGNTYYIKYQNIYGNSILTFNKEDLIEVLIETIKELDTIIPDFANNLINI